jgi:hypothetical protein
MFLSLEGSFREKKFLNIFEKFEKLEKLKTLSEIEKYKKFEKIGVGASFYYIIAPKFL